jgi:hypothetical protein
LYDLPVPSLTWSLGEPEDVEMCRYDSQVSGYGFYIHGSSLSNQCTKHYLYTFTDTSEHCVFTDNGCFMVVTNCTDSGTVTQATTWQHVAESITNFIQLEGAVYPGNNSLAFSNVLFREREVCL